MKITSRKSRAQQAYVELIVAMFVVIIGGIVIYKLARLIKNVLPPPATNSVTVYYQTNYASQFVSQILTTNFDSLQSQQTDDSNNFTFSYGLWSSNTVWITTTNPIPIAGGDVRVIIDTTNEYAVAINMGTYDLYYDCDANSGELLSSPSNGVCAVVIQKSTNLVDWYPYFTNSSCVPGSIQTFTDTNGVESKAFYRIRD